MIKWQSNVPIKTQADLLSLNRSSLYYRPTAPTTEELAVKNRIESKAGWSPERTSIVAEPTLTVRQAGLFDASSGVTETFSQVVALEVATVDADVPSIRFIHV